MTDIVRNYLLQKVLVFLVEKTRSLKTLCNSAKKLIQLCYRLKCNVDVRQVLHVQKVLPSVQEVVTQLYKKIIYKLDHIFLDIEYDIIMASRNIKMGKASWT